MFPQIHEGLYNDIADRGGAVLWPFKVGTPARSPFFHMRNRILVALADIVVVTQAPVPSGALNAARHARNLCKELWAVGAPPWDAGFTGSRDLIDKGARVLTSIGHFLDQTGLDRMVGPLLFGGSAAVPSSLSSASSGGSSSFGSGSSSTFAASSRPSSSGASSDASRAVAAPSLRNSSRSLAARPFKPRLTQLPILDATERALLEATSAEPRHLDEIAARARVCTSAAATGLLTLALENVVVEGPGGFYRRGFDV
jgi:predicted Rossmann fold nucleotide-binding protein DprA/Smf involved in DNA uptake